MNNSNPFPHIDLHRHLDGSIRVSTILELAKRYKLPLPSYDISELETHIFIQDRSSDLMAFLQKLDYGVSTLVNVEACERIALENVEDLKREGIHYAELRFSPYYMAMKHHLPMEEVVSAVIRGTTEGQKQFGVKVKLIGILSRTFGVEQCESELDALLAHRDQIAGLDLAGDEFNYPAKLFAPHFARARANTQWKYTVHAGEADGANSVWDAIHLLHANRIGHGVRATEDEALLAYMAENKIGVESCLTSNYQTGTWIDTKNHPLKTFMSQGIEASLHTDDPGVSNITLDHEFSIAREVLGLSDKTCLTLRKNALKQAFLSDEEKQRITQTT